MALELTQPLTEMSTRNNFWGECGRCVGLTTLPTSCADCLEIWEPQPHGTLWTCPSLQWDCFTFTFISTNHNYGLKRYDQVIKNILFTVCNISASNPINETCGRGYVILCSDKTYSYSQTSPLLIRLPLSNLITGSLYSNSLSQTDQT
jgi:hypothetical protein